MIKISNSKLISIFTKLLILLVVAKFISFMVWFFLPNNSIEFAVKENYQPKYQRVDFNNMIKNNVNLNVKVKDNYSGVSITNMILKGLYGKGSKGFVIVAMKSMPKKTTIVEVGEIYEGYLLKSIFPRSAKFHKNGDDFILSLEKVKVEGVVSKVQNSKYNGLSSIINRNDIRYYAKNPTQIWQNISIKEMSNGRGFKITRIVDGSKFANLGLKKGDLIIKANNVRLVSFQAALDLYKKIDILDMIQVVVIRDNQEMELVYEIN